MKQAGQKNDSAWFRINKKIKKLQTQSPTMAVQLQGVIATLDNMPAAYSALQDMAAKAGFDGDVEVLPDSSDDWAVTLGSKGIPRQLWNGELSFDTYLPPNSTGNTKDYYVKEHGEVFRQFGIELRKTVTQFFRSRRALADLQNVKSRAQGNPSGVADATKNT